MALSSRPHTPGSTAREGPTIRSALNSVALPGRALISPYCGRIPPVLSPSLPVAGAVRSLQLMRTHPAPILHPKLGCSWGQLAWPPWCKTCCISLVYGFDRMYAKACRVKSLLHPTKIYSFKSLLPLASSWAAPCSPLVLVAGTGGLGQEPAWKLPPGASRHPTQGLKK